MNLRKTLTLGALAIVICSFAQPKKPVLSVERFTGSVNNKTIELLRNNVISGIQRSGRVEVVDISNEDALKAEQARREREEAMGDAGRVEDMTALMSNAILKGTVDNLTVTRKQRKNYDGKIVTYYEAVVSYSLSIINASNGTLVESKTFKSSADGDTEQLAATACLEVKQKPLERFINNAYKADGKILQTEDDGKKAKKVYVSLGSNDGVKKGQKLEVYKEIDIAGEISRKLIGEITIEEVMSASRCLCKVNKGGDVILVEFNKDTKMPVTTKEEKAGFFSSMFED